MVDTTSGLTRRELIAGIAALTVLPSSLLATEAQRGRRDIWLSAQGDASDSYSLGWFDSGNASKVQIPSGFRGHGISLHPKKNCALMFARRPGKLAIEVDLESRAFREAFQCKHNRHLFGHGCFSADAGLLFSTEADIDSGQGLIAIRDANSYELLDEIPSHGIGPHELKLLGDGKTLVVANGGILTHPDSGRKKLNLDSMVSNLCYIDTASGSKLSLHRVPETKASIRHLDVADDDTVAIAMQFQRSAAAHERLVPLAASHRLGGPIRLFKAPEPLLMQMQDYIGSVAINSKRRIAGFTSPKGSVALFWNLDTSSLLGYHRLHDVCGIAVTADERCFALTSSNGQMRLLDTYSLKEDRALRRHPDVRWDNHLLLTTG
ncbi:MAG: DUF1513 domain-containing protein [Candidatus Thiodiazotropha sp. (ex Lucina pensylvanica)]|nr:DUF1513 domain-containing protein [Candidatus Thiodiazotropha sp. (ex Lucina pensylvanica)]MBT3051852.1 DUF1513 domain-containing protein [Candidatus Thiodiazotropha sp. (ex Codakia orbicularis)]